jgi:hypothetical protein
MNKIKVVSALLTQYCLGDKSKKNEMGGGGGSM